MLFSFYKYREFAIELTDDRGNGDGKISHEKKAKISAIKCHRF